MSVSSRVERAFDFMKSPGNLATMAIFTQKSGNFLSLPVPKTRPFGERGCPLPPRANAAAAGAGDAVVACGRRRTPRSLSHGVESRVVNKHGMRNDSAACLSHRCTLSRSPPISHSVCVSSLCYLMAKLFSRRIIECRRPLFSLSHVLLP